MSIIPAPEPMPEWAAELNRKMDLILETHLQVVSVVDDLKPEVMSIVESLQTNPMFKMFLGGKKK